jgi:rhamnosyltransferase
MASPTKTGAESPDAAQDQIFADQLPVSDDKPLPRVLVLMATYNGREWLREQIDSILAQEDVNVHLYFSDDLSTDGSRDVIASYLAGNAKIQLSEWTSGSGSAGANFRRMFLSAPTSGFEYVALADQDDVWCSRKLVSAIEALDEAAAEGYSAAVDAFWPDGRVVTQRQSPEIKALDFLFEGAGQGCSFVLRQRFFAKVQSFCLAHPVEISALHYHDWLIYALARSWQDKWYFDERAFMRYRQHANNEIGSRGSMGSIFKRLHKIRDGWYREQVRAAADISVKAVGDDAAIRGFLEVFNRNESLARRLSMIAFVLRSGRRRVTDRIVLAVSAGAGWL